MTAAQKFRDGDIGPAVILVLFCAVITWALAYVYQITAPLIAQQNERAENAARTAVMPLADSFVRLEGLAWPDGVTDVYAAQNGTGYVFTSGAKGFGGMVLFMIGMDTNGHITGIQLFAHNETPGLGSKVGASDYLAQYHGAADAADIDAVSGATKTSHALKNALAQAKQAFGLVKEAG